MDGAPQLIHGKDTEEDTGAAACEVEIDPITGELEVDRYTVVDDLGVLMNPRLAEGQVPPEVVGEDRTTEGEQQQRDGERTAQVGQRCPCSRRRAW